MNKKLVVVADGSRAQILSAKGRKLHDVIHECENTELNSHEINPIREGQAGNGHFLDPQTDPKDHEKALFAKSLSNSIHSMVREGPYESLILVASPQMLGLLRKQINGHIPIDRSLCLEATRLNKEQLEDRIFN